MMKTYRKDTHSLKKITSILIILLLLTTSFSTMVSSKGLLTNITSKINDAKNKLEQQKNEISKKTRTADLKEKTQTITEKIKNRTSITKDRLKKLREVPLFSSLINLIKLRSASSKLSLYTNYAGKEKTSPIQLGIPTTVDIDDDGDKDIKASFSIYPFIEKSLSFSFNIRLKIDRLSGFEDIHEFFQTYVELTFPGLLYINQAGDKVQFGYQSDKGDEVPDTCYVTYKYLPYLFFKEKPKHKVSLSPGTATDKDNLALVFAYCNYDNTTDEYSTRSRWITTLSPSVKTEITFGGADEYFGRQFKLETSKPSLTTIHYTRYSNGSEFNGGLVIDKISSFSFEMEITPFKKGGGRIEYIRDSSDSVDVTLFFKKNDTGYIYVDDVPQHARLSWTPEKKGEIELNTFNKRIKRIGIRDTPPNLPIFKANAYIENLSSFIKFNWNWELKNGGKLDIFCEEDGVSAHIITHDLIGTGTTLLADIISNENINMSIFWDSSKKSFGIRRTNSDIQLALHVRTSNGTAFNFSTGIKNTINGPFEIVLGDLFDGKADLTFTSNTLEIYNLDTELYLPSVGTFFAKLNSLSFDKSQSGIRFGFSAKKENEKYNLSCEIEIFNGVKIKGFIVGFNEMQFSIPDIDVAGYKLHKYSFEISQGFVDFYISPDGNSGYVIISGGIAVSFYKRVERPIGTTIGLVKGTVQFETENDKLNISWKNESGQMQINADGRGVVSLSGFELMIKDKIDVKIPLIAGRFYINTKCKTGFVQLFLDDSTASFNTNFSIDIKDYMNITLGFDLDADFTVGLSGYIAFSWYHGTGLNITTFQADGTASYDGTIDIYDLYFRQKGPRSRISTSVSADSISLSGGFKVNVDISKFGIDFESEEGTSLEIWYFKFINLNVTAMRLSFLKLYLGGSGKISADVNQKLITFDANVLLTLLSFYYYSKIPNTSATIITGGLQIHVGGEITLDFNNRCVSFDVSGFFSLSQVSFLQEYISSDEEKHIFLDFGTSAKAKGRVSWTNDSANLFLDMTKPIEIDGFHFFTKLISVSWTKLHISLVDDAEAYINFTSGAVKIYTNVKAIEWTGLRVSYKTGDPKKDEMYMEFHGKMTFNFNGKMLILLSIDPDQSSFTLDINRGEMTLSDFGFLFGVLNNVNATSVAMEVRWDELTINGQFKLDLISSDQGMTISASGKGDVTLDGMDAEAYLNGEKALELGYFKLDLDDVSGSIVNLVLSKPLKIESANGEGSISEIIIEDLFMTIDMNPNDEGFDFEVEELIVDLQGAGYFTFDVFKNDPKLFSAILSVTSPLAYIDMKHFLLVVPAFISLEINDLNIQDQTTISLTGFGNVVEDELPEFEIRISADSVKWSIGTFDLAAFIPNVGFIKLFGIEQVTGNGEITLGIRNWQLEYGFTESGLPQDMILGFNGDFDWKNFYIYTEIIAEIGVLLELIDESSSLYDFLKNGKISTHNGSFDGYADIYIDFPMLIIGYLGNVSIEINVYSPTTINIAELSGRDGYISIISLVAQPGYINIYPHIILLYVPDEKPGSITIESSGTCKPVINGLRFVKYSWNLDFSVASLSLSGTYMNLKWDLFGSEPYLFIDTNNELCSATVTFANTFSFTGSIRADDLLIELNELNIDGIGDIIITNNGANLSQASIKIGDDLTFTGTLPKYMEIGWDINFDGNGYLLIDTNRDWCTLRVKYKHLIDITGGFWADKRELSWNFDAGLFNIFSSSGEWGWDPNFNIDVYVASQSRWYQLWPLGSPPPQDQLNVEVIYTGDKLFENDPFTVHVTDAQTSAPVSGAIVCYRAYNDEKQVIHETSKTTDNNGDADFIAIEVPSDDADRQILCEANATASGYKSNSKYFFVWDKTALIQGYVKDVNGNGIRSALVTTNVGGYSTYTRDKPALGLYQLKVDPGTYKIIATKEGYEQGESAYFTIGPGDNLQVPDIILQSNFGYIEGTVYEKGTNKPLYLAKISLDGGKAIDVNSNGHYIIEANPGKHTLKATCVNHHPETKYNIQVNQGQTTQVDFYLEQAGQWIHPTSYNDPLGHWSNEQYAYDSSNTTYAETKKYYIAQYTGYLELFLSQTIECTKIKFIAYEDINVIDKAKIDVYYDGSWHNIWDGAYPSMDPYELFVDPINKDSYQVSKARISFHVRTGIGNFAELYDFQFYKLG